MRDFLILAYEKSNEKNIYSFYVYDYTENEIKKLNLNKEHFMYVFNFGLFSRVKLIDSINTSIDFYENIKSIEVYSRSKVLDLFSIINIRLFQLDDVKKDYTIIKVNKIIDIERKADKNLFVLEFLESIRKKTFLLEDSKLISYIKEDASNLENIINLEGDIFFLIEKKKSENKIKKVYCF